MRKKLLLTIAAFIALAMLVAMSACSTDELMPDAQPDANNQQGRTLSLTAAMPQEPTTRVGLTQEDDKSITLTWQDGDELQLVFVQGETKAKTIATVKTISTDKKQATFDIQIPDEFDTGVYDLYGVYGGGGLSDANPTQVQLPTNPGNATSLDGNDDTSVQNRKDVILYFECTDIDAGNPQASAIFQHLGSLFSFTLQNNGSVAIDDINEVRLSSDETNNNWAYNTGGGNQVYDFETGFQNKETGSSHYIYFNAADKSIAVGEHLTFWAWYPPLPDVNWPALKIELIKADDSIVASANALPARGNPTVAGKSYYFYAAWDDTELNFTNETFSNELTIDVAEMGTLITLLSPTQKSIVKKLTVTGQINEIDYEVMKKQMPGLTYVDLSKVTSYEGEIVNKIPYEAFGSYMGESNRTISTIILPESLTGIGVESFCGCTSLAGNLKLPSGLTTIETRAFLSCTSLSGSLNIPTSVTTIGNSAFQNSTFDGDLVLPPNLTIIESKAFASSSFTGTLTLPADLTTIKKDAFLRCFSFTGSLVIPDNVTTIGENAFSYCSGFNGTLTLPTQLKTIESYAFANCSTLVGNIFIPDKVTAIGDHAFYECNDITAFQFPHTTPIAYTLNMLTSGKTVEVQAQAVATYQGADGWSNHPIVPMYDEYAVNVATKGTMSTLLTPLQKANIRKLTVTGQINKADYDVMKLQMPNLKIVDLSQVISYEDETVNKIPVAAFGDQNYSLAKKTITTIIFPESVTNIGSEAFENCSGLTDNLVLPAALEVIGNNAFASCDGFTGDLIIPDNVTTIRALAFSYCIGFNGTLTLPTQLKTIESYAFANCSTLVGNIFIPDKVTAIGDHAFYECNDITAFQFPHTTPIAYTLNMLTSGKTVEVQAQAVATYKGADGWSNHPIVPMYDEYAVNVATKGTMSTLLTPLQKANIRKLTVTGQINKADYDVMKLQMPNLKIVDLSQVISYEDEIINKIPDEAFKANQVITTIIFPKSVIAIGNSAFESCEGLKGELILPAELITVGRAAFYQCSGFTGSLTIPDKVTTIGNQAFAFCYGLNGSLFLPAALETIGNYAFNQCIGFTGDLIIPDKVTTIGYSAFEVCGFTGSLTLPEGLRTIGEYAFGYCSNITGTVVFPSTLTSIGSYGFNKCTSIEAFQFPHTTPIPYTTEMLTAGKPVEVPGSAVMLYLDNADWVPRHPISAYVGVDVEVPPM